MREVGFEAFIILLLVIGNGLFAMSEIAIVSARKARLQQWANEGNLRAKNALALANAPHRSLATIQIGITLVGTLAGAYGGATLADKLAGKLEGVPWISDYRHGFALFIVVLVLTYFQVILGELVPKSVALHNAERIASHAAVPMQWLSRLASPLVSFLELSTTLILRLLGSRPSKEPPVTGDEINVMIAQGTEAGVFQESQQDMVEGVIALNNIRVNAIMTPRPDIVWLDTESPPEEIRERLLNSSYSRFPVCRESLDHVLGVVHTKDLLADCLSDKPLNLEGRLRKALTIPENIPVLKSLESFKESRIHMALVIDEYGSLQGLVTMNDILESIVGDIPSHDHKEEEPEAVKREDGSWLVDGMQSVEDFKELMGLERLPGEEGGSYQTLGGFVMTQLGKIPKAGERFVRDYVRYEVMDMDGNRVDKVMVQKQIAPEGAESKKSPRG